MKLFIIGGKLTELTFIRLSGEDLNLLLEFKYELVWINGEIERRLNEDAEHLASLEHPPARNPDKFEDVSEEEARAYVSAFNRGLEESLRLRYEPTLGDIYMLVDRFALSAQIIGKRLEVLDVRGMSLWQY